MGLLTGAAQQNWGLNLEESGLVEESSNFPEGRSSQFQPSDQSTVAGLLVVIGGQIRG